MLEFSLAQWLGILGFSSPWPEFSSDWGTADLIKPWHGQKKKELHYALIG